MNKAKREARGKNYYRDLTWHERKAIRRAVYLACDTLQRQQPTLPLLFTGRFDEPCVEALLVDMCGNVDELVSSPNADAFFTSTNDVQYGQWRDSRGGIASMYWRSVAYALTYARSN